MHWSGTAEKPAIYFLDATGSLIFYSKDEQTQYNYNHQPVPFVNVFSASEVNPTSTLNGIWAVDAFGVLWTCYQKPEDYQLTPWEPIMDRSRISTGNRAVTVSELKKTSIDNSEIS